MTRRTGLLLDDTRPWRTLSWRRSARFRLLARVAAVGTASTTGPRGSHLPTPRAAGDDLRQPGHGDTGGRRLPRQADRAPQPCHASPRSARDIPDGATTAKRCRLVRLRFAEGMTAAAPPETGSASGTGHAE